MKPVLFYLFGFPIRSWSILLLIGFLLAWWLASRRAAKFGLTKDQLGSLSLTMLISGIVGARVFWVVQEWHLYQNNWLQAFNFSEGGMTSFGGSFFGIAALIIWCRMSKISALAALDLVAAPALVAIAVGRAGCFLNGCCYGSPCDLPWAVTIHDDQNKEYLGHPAQLYDSAMNLIGAALLFRFEKVAGAAGKYRRGRYIGWGLILMGVSRFIYEMFRIGASSAPTRIGLPITDAQIVAVLMAIVGLIILVRTAKTQPPHHSGAEESQSG